MSVTEPTAPPRSPQVRPAIHAAAAELSRTLSATTSRHIAIEVVGERRTHAKPGNPAQLAWFGMPGGVLVGLTPTVGPMLAALLLNFEPTGTARDLSAVEQRLLNQALLPTMQVLADQIRDPQVGVDVEGLYGDEAYDQVRGRILTELTLAVTAQAGRGVTVSGEVVMVAASPMRHATAAATLDTLDGVAGDIPADVQVALPPSLVPARDLANLSPGSTLNLAPLISSPWLLRVGDVLVAAGELGQVNSRRSTAITLTWRNDTTMSDNLLNDLDAAHRTVSSLSGDAEDGPELGALGDVQVAVSAEAGRTTMSMRELATMRPGHVLELDTIADAPFVLLANGQPLAKVELNVVDQRYTVTVLEVLNPR